MQTTGKTVFGCVLAGLSLVTVVTPPPTPLCFFKGGKASSTFPHQRPPCKHTALKKHILQAVSNNCQIHKAKMQLPPGSHLSTSTLLPWEGNTGGPWHQAVRRTSPWPFPQAGQTFPKHCFSAWLLGPIFHLFLA